MSSKFTLSTSKMFPPKEIKTTAARFCLQTLLAYPRAKAYPRVLNMYFEGCLGFNVIQQNGLMSRVFVGSFLLLRITSRPTAFIRLDLWVLIWKWIIGYLPPLPSHLCSVAYRSCVQLRSWENTRQPPHPPTTPPSPKWARNTHKNELQTSTFFDSR